MANPPVAFRREGVADIVAPWFTVYIARPSGTGWLGELEEPLYEPISITESDGGEMSTLILRVELGSDPRLLLDEQGNIELTRWVQAGSRVRIVDTAKDPGEEWFVGYVGQDTSLIQGNPDQESYNLTVYGPEWRLSGPVVTGQWYANSATDSKIILEESTSLVRLNISQSDIRCVFNADRLPNMSQELWDVGTAGKVDSPTGGAVFVSGDRRILNNGTVKSEAKIWTAYRALRSVVEWIDDYEVISPTTDWKAIETTLSGVTIGEVSIDGLTVLESIGAILSPLGYGFALDVASDGDETFRHVLRVYALKASITGKTPYLAPIGSSVTDANGSRGELARLDFLRDSHNIRNAVTVCGQLELVQVQLKFQGDSAAADLFPAWSQDSDPITSWLDTGIFKVAQVTNPETLIADYHSTGSNFNEKQDVFRTFVFNEDGGGLDTSYYGANAIPALESYGLGVSKFRRPIGPMLDRSQVTSDFRKPLIQMQTTVSGETFTINASKFFESLKDRAGIRLTKDFFAIEKDQSLSDWKPFEQLGEYGTDTAARKLAKDLSWLTMLNNALTQSGDSELVLLVTGTMRRDLCVKGSVDRLSTSPLHLTRARLVRDNALQSKVVFGTVVGTPDTRDDSGKALAIAKAVQFADDSETGHGSLMFHSLTRGYPPGTVISQTAGRVLKFQLDGQRIKSAPVVRKVTHNLRETNVTEVLIDSPLVRLL